MSLTDFFPSSYRESRETFLRKLAALERAVESFVLPDKVGVEGETLAMDIARIGDPLSRDVLIITAGTHGVEGFCGAGCLHYLLDDRPLHDLATKNGVGIILVHGVNPFGFSHIRRVNENNVDLNRNWLDFSAGMPVNTQYGDLDGYLIPDAWPPLQHVEAELQRVIASMGVKEFRNVIATGQYTHETGLYFGGTKKSWSLETLFGALQIRLKDARQVGWIDIHTGLGPYGHGEKMYVGRADPDEEARARRWWGQDVSSVNGGDAASGTVSGAAVQMIYDLGIPLQSTVMALEYGTLGTPKVGHAMRGDHWLYRHDCAPPAQAYAIKKAIKDAFYCDEPVWKGMVLAQFRAAVIQSLNGLARERDV